MFGKVVLLGTVLVSSLFSSVIVKNETGAKPKKEQNFSTKEYSFNYGSVGVVVFYPHFGLGHRKRTGNSAWDFTLSCIVAPFTPPVLGVSRLWYFDKENKYYGFGIETFPTIIPLPTFSYGKEKERGFHQLKIGFVWFSYTYGMKF